MAASVSTLASKAGRGVPIRRYGVTWVSASDGTNTLQWPDTNTVDDVQNFSGNIVGIALIDVTTPTDAFDMTLKTDIGWDVLNGNGANVTVANLPIFLTANDLADIPLANDSLTFGITNAGDSKSISMYLYLR